jgi:uncharacterized membrane protein
VKKDTLALLRLYKYSTFSLLTCNKEQACNKKYHSTFTPGTIFHKRIKLCSCLAMNSESPMQGTAEDNIVQMQLAQQAVNSRSPDTPQSSKDSAAATTPPVPGMPEASTNSPRQPGEQGDAPDRTSRRKRVLESCWCAPRPISLCNF